MTDQISGNGKDTAPCAIHVIFKVTGSIEDMVVNFEGQVTAAQISLTADELHFIADQLRLQAAVIEAQKHIQVPQTRSDLRKFFNRPH